MSESEYFIKNEKQAYTLGFLWADGNLGKKSALSIQINKTDADEVHDIFLDFADFHTYHCSKKKDHPTWQDTVTFHKTDKKRYNILERHGFKEKSNVSHESILKIIPNQFHCYFWRGFFDGDGCIYLRKNAKLGQLVFASSYEQDWSYLRITLSVLGIVCSESRVINKKNHKSSRLRVTGLDSLCKFIDYIYPSGYDGIGLKRKYTKLRTMKSWQDERINNELFCKEFISKNAFKLQKQKIAEYLKISVPKINRIVKDCKITMPYKNYWHRNDSR